MSRRKAWSRSLDRPQTSSADSEQGVAIGEVVGAYGLRGEVRVQPLTDFPDRFGRLHHVWVRMPDGTRMTRRVLSSRPHETKGLVVLRLKGVASREAARALVGAVLEVPDAEAVPLPEGVFFEHDIVGLRVVTTDGRELGPVSEVLHTGANDVYVTPTCLVPAIADVIREVDIAGGRMVIEAVPGLLDP